LKKSTAYSSLAVGGAIVLATVLIVWLARASASDAPPLTDTIRADSLAVEKSGHRMTIYANERAQKSYQVALGRWSRAEATGRGLEGTGGPLYDRWPARAKRIPSSAPRELPGFHGCRAGTSSGSRTRAQHHGPRNTEWIRVARRSSSSGGLDRWVCCRHQFGDRGTVACST
jgi:hypothetical protein